MAQGTLSVLCGDLNGKEIQNRGHLCTCITDSLCNTAGTHATLQRNYTPIKINKQFCYFKKNFFCCQSNVSAFYLFILSIHFYQLEANYFTRDTDVQNRLLDSMGKNKFLIFLFLLIICSSHLPNQEICPAYHNTPYSSATFDT